MKRMIKGVIAVLLSLAMSLSLLGDSVLAIDHEILLKRNGITDQTCIYECDDVSITFSVTEKWENGYTAQVRVSNLTTECLDNWHLEMLTTDDISNIWNARVLTKTPESIEIENDGWNQDIEANSAIEFGFDSNSPFSSFPEIRMNPSKEMTLAKECYTYQYTVTDNWVGGFNSKIDVFNTSEDIIKEWQLSFEFDNEIQNIWNAEIISHIGNIYVVKGKKYNQNIDIGNKIEIGFTVIEGNSANEARCISISEQNPNAYEYSSIPFPKEDYYKDNDGDGVANIIEYFFGLNYETKDSNNNGSSDFDALIAFLRYGLADDTDGDGISDFSEYYYGLDPNKPCSFDDGINDASRRMTVTMHGAESDINEVRPFVTITTEGRYLDSFQVTKVEGNPFLNSTIPGYFCNAYDLSVEGNVDDAVLSFDIPDSIWNQIDYIPTIYYFNDATQELEEVANQYREGNRICVKLSHFSKYLLINKRVTENNLSPIEIIAPSDNIYANTAIGLVFSLDESGSLSSSDFDKMKNAAVSLVDELNDDDSVSVFTFDDKIRKHCSFADKDEAERVINNLTQHSGLTAIKDATLSAIDEFTVNGPEDATRILILLTDGYSNYDRTRLSYQQVAQKAADNNIIIYTIGVGNVSKSALDTLATLTEGQYYGISDFNKLSQVFKQVLIDAEVFFDSDYDGISDYHEKKIAQNQMRLATGAEIPEYKLMDYLNPDSDGDLLEDGQELEIVTTDRGVFVRYFSSPFLPDTDNDGFDDYAEDLMGTSPTDEFDPYVSEYDTKSMNMGGTGESRYQTNPLGGGKHGYKGIGTIIPDNPSLLHDISYNTFWQMALEEYSWGYIHRQVLEHIDDNKDGIMIEYTIADKKRCDVINITEGMVWEVKPISYYKNILKQEKAMKQLNKYKTMLSERDNLLYISGDNSIKSYSFETKNKDYIVSYVNAGKGIIYYSFSKNDNDNPDPNSGVITNKDSDNDSNDNDNPKNKFKQFPFSNKDKDDIAAMKRRIAEIEPKVIVVEKPSADIIVDIGMLIILCADDIFPGMGQVDDALAVKKVYDILRKGKVLLEFVIP